MPEATESLAIRSARRSAGGANEYWGSLPYPPGGDAGACAGFCGCGSRRGGLHHDAPDDTLRQRVISPSPAPRNRRVANGGSLTSMIDGEARASAAVSLLVDLDSGTVSRMDEMTLASAGLKERDDLQRWITEHPDLVAPDLLLITTEFDRWEIRDQRVADRLDVLFLDTTGAPVVAELKRDRATDTVELQALKYAAYCSQLTLDELAEEYAAAWSVSPDEARQQLMDHAPGLEDGGPRSVKIRLIAGSFGPAVTSVVLWLREFGIDIGCIEVSARRVDGSRQAVISARQLLPLPETEDYLVRRRRKEQEEERARDEPTEWTWEGYAARFPERQLTIARRAFEQLTRYVDEHQLPWTPAFRAGWLGYQRPGGYYVPLIALHRANPIEFSVKLPDDPTRLGLANPYPQLKSRWDDSSRQWTWAIPSADDVPDLSVALKLSSELQPESGPMPRPDAHVSGGPSPADGASSSVAPWTAGAGPASSG